jgi:acetyltransferase-like isoleucine patch superfamily enzyme
MTEVLRVPYLGTAEDEVTVALWHVAEGEAFKKGDALVVLETLKASFDVEAEADGVLLRRLVSEGRRLQVHAALGVYGEAGEELTDAQLARLIEGDPEGGGSTPSLVVEEDDLVERDLQAPDSLLAEGHGSEAKGSAPAPAMGKTEASAAAASVANGDKDTPAAPAARRRAKELGIQLSNVPGTGPGGMVRLADVDRFVRQAEKDGSIASNGELEADFARYLREEGEQFAALSSEFKVALYRKHGALLGEDAHIGKGSYIVADRLVAGPELYLGDDVRIEVIDFEAGPMAAFQKGTRVKARQIRLGANAFFAPDVEVGGGGAMDPEAQLVIGSHGFVGEHVHLNPCRKIEIGDEVVISRSAVLMTHSFGASSLDGYPNRFAGITISDRCQVGIGCTLFPGVEMGAGSILLSGSSLVTSMPEGRLFGGVPAKDLKAAKRDLRDDERVEVGRELVQEFARQMVLRGHGMEADQRDTELRLTLRMEGRHVIRFAKELPLGEGDLLIEDIRVGLRIEDEAWERMPIEFTAIDLGKKRIRGPGGPLTDALREFLRKRGIRLEPRTWSYRGGLL